MHDHDYYMTAFQMRNQYGRQTIVLIILDHVSKSLVYAKQRKMESRKALAALHIDVNWKYALGLTLR